MLCESFENRSRKKKDTFCKGQRLFQLAKTGAILVNDYGPNQAWYPTQRCSRRLSFLKRSYLRSFGEKPSQKLEILFTYEFVSSSSQNIGPRLVPSPVSVKFEIDRKLFGVNVY